jgi:hypothetical protein
LKSLEGLSLVIGESVCLELLSGHDDNKFTPGEKRKKVSEPGFIGLQD